MIRTDPPNKCIRRRQPHMHQIARRPAVSTRTLVMLFFYEQFVKPRSDLRIVVPFGLAENSIASGISYFHISTNASTLRSRSFTQNFLCICRNGIPSFSCKCDIFVAEISTSSSTSFSHRRKCEIDWVNFERPSEPAGTVSYQLT